MIGHGQQHRVKAGKLALTRRNWPQDQLRIGLMPWMWLIKFQAVYRPSDVGQT
jgi:hypothetical protein